MSTPAPNPRPQSRVASSSRQTTASGSIPVPKQEHTTTALSRLKHMFDAPKYSILEAHLRIEELANVPQLEGGFAAQYKFRGKRMEKNLNNKPSLPNLKVNGSQSSTLSPLTSASSTSLRSPLPMMTTARPVASPENSLLDSSARAKALSLPPNSLALSPVVSEDSTTPAATQVDKKTSDPTPLREVTTAPIARTSSPEQMSPVDVANEPPDVAEASESRRTSGESDESPRSSRSGSAAPSIAPSVAVSAGSAPATAPSSRRGSLHPPAHGSLLPHSMTMAASSSPALEKPFPKSLNAPARSGTSPSPAILVDHLPNRNEFLPEIAVRPPVSRTVSHNTTSTASTGISSIIPRNRVVSGPGAFGGKKPKEDPGYATSRKGTTPVCQLKAHTVTWNYDIRYVLRVPLVKQAGAGGVETPGRKVAGPMLGQGPLSESGFRLVFEQVPDDRGDKTPSGMTIDSPHKEQSRHHEKVEFGTVDIDLAPFAGKGPQTRRFLLKKSRTNAVVKLTVDVRLIGGETNFTTPPLVEGHHISGVTDMMVDVSERAARDTHDLRMTRTASNSSSSNSSSHPSQSSSAIDLSLPQTHSAVDLSRRAPNMTYKSYEHHLKPADALRPSPKREMSKLSQFSLRSPSPGSTPRQTPSRQISALPSQSPESATQTPPASPTAAKLVLESPTTAPASPEFHLFGGHHKHHRHHAHHLHPKRQDSVLGANRREMLPEEVIEAVFNPRPSHERTPFTYKVEPKSATPTRPDEGEGPGSYIMIDPAAQADKPRPAGRWERMKARTASARHSRGIPTSVTVS